MTRATLTAAALVLSAVAGTAHAADKPADLGDSWMTYNRATNRFCLMPKSAPMGSHIISATCRSQAGWAARGVKVALR